MEGTRLRILILLQREDQATAEQIAQAVGLSYATVRRHLDILQRDRLVAYKVARRRTGRPEHVYFLTEAGQEALPKQYHRLLSLLLQELRNPLHPEPAPSANGQNLLTHLLLRVSEHILEEQGNSFAEKPLAERVSLLRQILQEEQFSPEVEQTEGSVRLRLLNCPFRAVSLENEAVCCLDADLISRVLGAPALREEWLHRGNHTCTYLVQLKPASLRRSPSS